METHTAPHVTFVERLSSGVVVSFDDGRCALFSASLLHAIIPYAEELTDLPNPTTSLDLDYLPDER